MRAQIGLSRSTQALLGLFTVLVMMVVLLSVTSVFRSRRPSPFSEPGGYGVGSGRETIMVGANARNGAARATR